jgi:DNA-binding NtrC family response regulator
MATRILLIDDNPADRFLAKRALAAEFPDLEVAEILDQVGFDAALERLDVDVIVTDYQLRWTDGLQALAAVREAGYDAPVVMFAHTGSEEIAAEGLRAGLVDYIVKTANCYERLAHSVRKAMKNASAIRDEREARGRDRAALRTAENAVRVRDEFLATHAHELRTSLKVVALFNANNDTVEMVRRMLDASGLTCLVGCHFADLKKGRIDFARYLGEHDPDLVIFDISPPYKENWKFFQTLHQCKAMEGRGLVLTTTNKARLDEEVGKDSAAFEIVGKPYDLAQIKGSIDAALNRVREVEATSRR